MLTRGFCLSHPALSLPLTAALPKPKPRSPWRRCDTSPATTPSPPYLLPSRSLPLPKTPPRKLTTTQQKPPCPPPPPPPRQHTDLLVDSYHHNHELRRLLTELANGDSDPLGVLDRHGDWSTEQLWAVVAFLREGGRINEIMQVFDAWTSRERSRINASNYSKMIHILCEESWMDEAVAILEGMESCGLATSVPVYNAVVNGFAAKGEFDSAKEVIRKMVEIGLVPVPETYNGLIRAYGDRRMYDELSKCVKKMGLEGCSPDEVSYNLVIVEYARGRLVEKMEGVCRTLMSKRMNLLPSTLVAMLEAYTDLGILEKTERIYRRILNSNGFLKEGLIRKVAMVYVENYRFVRLEEFGNEISSRTGRTPLVWCMLLLASACLLSRKGMESVMREMEDANARPSITFVNILAVAYMKMKDFRSLDGLLSRVGERKVKPDMATTGILFDACEVGYDGRRALEMWRKNGFLDEVAEMNTDPLVLAAYGKGSFLKTCEEFYAALGSKAKKKKVWRYCDLISLVFRNRSSGKAMLEAGKQ